MQRKYIFFTGLCLALAITGYWVIGHYFKSEHVPETQKAALPLVETALEVKELPIRTTLINVSRQSLPQNAFPLLEDWLAATLEHNGMHAQQISLLLSEVLHHYSKPNEPIFQRVLQILNDSSIPSTVKFALLEIINRAATPSSLRFLIDLSKQNLSMDVKQAVVRAISQTGDYFWAPQSLPVAVPMLLQTWGQSQDPEMLRAVSMALARTGNVAGVNQLLDSILIEGATLEQVRESKDARALAALDVISMIHNPELIPSVAHRLNGNNISIAEASLCTGILASMQDAYATQCLMEWAQNASDRYAVSIAEAFRQIGDNSVRESIALTAKSAPFQSKAVQSAILSATQKR